MEQLGFDGINRFALDYYLGQGLKVSFDRLVHELEGGARVCGGDEGDNQNLLYSLKYLTEYALKKEFEQDLEGDLHASQTDGYHKNSTIENIDRVLCSQQPGNFSFPQLPTADLVNKVSNGINFTESIEVRESTRVKINQLLLQILEENSSLQITGQGPSKDLFLYAAQYLQEVKRRTDVSEFYFNNTVRAFLGSNELHIVPYVEFVEAFRSKLLSTIKILTPSFKETQSSTQNSLNELRERGNNLMSFLCYAQAIKVYTEALLLAPPFTHDDESQIYTNRAIAFIGLNCVPEAIDDLNAAIVLDRAFTPAWTQLGYCHLYMGNGLLALECYDLALRSAVGEILPNNFPNSGSIVDEYRSLRTKTVLPQFIKRLSSAIALTEKRAYQQDVPEDKIKNIISDVRKLLARLRAVGPEVDRDCFTYMPVYRDSSLRDLSQRINESRPNILTPEVTQNMLARNGMETATVTEIERPPHFNTERNPTARNPAGNREGSPDIQVFGPMNSETWPLSSLRDMIGGIAEGGTRNTAQNSQQPAPGGDTTGSGAADDDAAAAADTGTGDQSNSATNNSNANTNASRSPMSNERPNLSNMLPDAIRHVLNPGLLNTFERFTQGEGTGALFVNGVEVSGRSNNRQGGENTAHSETRQQAGTQTQTDSTNTEETRNRARDQSNSGDNPPDFDFNDQELD
ncbi:hypothetical protein CANMA_002275 [Candida margitis]|uniref:uncharacterized protein n=1 Tax=Candida margitis TaxID=1775924 RepID=UPI0022264EE6|nr:uncharacterized protein CANMA_002275 [Candida margitis]KAI5968530.1 hypothetical protein CANMA_002275 [Candida margitis]